MKAQDTKGLLFLSLILLLPIHISFTQLSETTDIINWSGNLDYGKSVAQKYNKPLFILFVDVPPNNLTKNIYSNIFSNSIITTKINENFIPVRVQGDAILEKEYNISGFPTILILEQKNFTEINRLAGIIYTDSVFSLLDDALKSIRSNTNNTVDTTETVVTFQKIYKYKGSKYTGKQDTGDGAFISLGDNKWIHSTPFYPRITFTEFNKDDKYFMVANRELNVFFAIPMSGKGTFWTLKKADSGNEDENTWIVAGRITEYIEQEINEYIQENSLIGQENTP